MDKLSSQKRQAVCQEIEAADTSLHFHSPFSPKLYLIEKALLDLKVRLREAKGQIFARNMQRIVRLIEIFLENQSKKAKVEISLPQTPRRFCRQPSQPAFREYSNRRAARFIYHHHIAAQPCFKPTAVVQATSLSWVGGNQRPGAR
jgi:hypothetical protein